MGSTGYVMTLANSIIGVSVLAMPYCFKQCGIVLSVLLLVLSGVMTRLCCHFLIKSAILARRRNYEFLAFHTFGPTGKLVVELSIIGFLLGTSIAFFVVMGDLGPDILTKAFQMESSEHLRPSVLIVLAVLVVLPLGLLRNVDSLSSVCTASILFYLCLVLKVVSEATPHLLAADWLDHVNLWRPAGVLQCMPIFSMALACQTQVFEIYESLPDASLSRMNEVVRAAVNMCTGVYVCVGFFGYVAFCTQNFSGNVLMSFSPSTSTDVMKLGFVLSVAVSFPLVIFPCRASLYSLLFRRVSAWHPELTGGPTHIPEGRFKCLTVVLVGVSLVVGLLLPNIELVLGLVGSTIGTVICLMLPALMFTRLASKHSSERLVAQGIFFVAASILVLSTYANLYAADKAGSELGVSLRPPELRKPPVLENRPNFDPPVVMGKGVIGEASQKLKEVADKLDREIKKREEKKKVKDEVPPALQDKPKQQEEPPRQEPPVPVEPGGSKPESQPAAPPKLEVPEVEQKKPPAKPEQPPTKPEQVAQEAIMKEEEERAAEEGPKTSAAKSPAAAVVPEGHQELLAKLAEHKQAQQNMLDEQKHLLAELKDQASDNKEVAKEPVKEPVPEIPADPKPEGGNVDVNKVDVIKEAAPVLPDQPVVGQEAVAVANQQPEAQVAPLVAKLQDIVAVPSEVKEQNLGDIVQGLQKLTKELKDSLDVMKQQQTDVKPAESNVKPMGALISEGKQARQRAQENLVEEKPVPPAAVNVVLPVANVVPIQPEVKQAVVQPNLNVVQPNVVPIKSNDKIEQKQIPEHNREKREAEFQLNSTCSQKDKQKIELQPQETPVNKTQENTLERLVKESVEGKAVVGDSVVKSEAQVQDNEMGQGVKPSLHLSVPELQMPGGHDDLSLTNEAAVMLGKPMSRDLKSVDGEEEKEAETGT